MTTERINPESSETTAAERPGRNDSNDSADRAFRLQAERDVQARLGDQPIDFESLDAISNIYRAAASVRRRAESEILSQANLSWGGFTILWVLWVWGEMETAQLADECGLAKGTLTGFAGGLDTKRFLLDHERNTESLHLF